MSRSRLRSRSLARYRATGADLPYGDPLPAHGVGMEGYFWRFTDVPGRRAAIALIGVNRGPSGPWATLGLGSRSRDGMATLQVADVDGGKASPTGVGAGAAGFSGDDQRVVVSLGGDRLDVRLDGLAPWPRRRFGGSSLFQAVPGLNQYWHPWLLGGRASGTAVFGGEEWRLDDAQVYAEKNWGREGFPDHWWWGQAQGFEDGSACVAFAGGEVTAGPLRTTVTALVVRLPSGEVLRLGDPVVSPVRAEVSEETWRLRGRGFGWRVEVEAFSPAQEAHVLPVPLPSERRNVAGAIESLTGELSVVVRRRGRTVWRGRTTLAGLENGGLARSARELRRRGASPDAVAAPPALDL